MEEKEVQKSYKWDIEFVVSLFGYILFSLFLFSLVSIESFKCYLLYIYWVYADLNRR